jgi:hypothetical protein
MAKDGTVVGMIPADDTKFGSIDWTNKMFKKNKRYKV